MLGENILGANEDPTPPTTMTYMLLVLKKREIVKSDTMNTKQFHYSLKRFSKQIQSNVKLYFCWKENYVIY